MIHPKWIFTAAVIPAVYLAGLFITLDPRWLVEVEAEGRVLALMFAAGFMALTATFPHEQKEQTND